MDYDGPIAVLTRATIRLSKLNSFWKNVDGVAQQMAGAHGLITSIGIGEVPFIKQATFSIWENKELMKAFAYQMHQHQDVIKKTKKRTGIVKTCLFVLYPFRPLAQLMDQTLLKRHPNKLIASTFKALYIVSR